MEIQEKVIQAFQVEHKDQVEGIRSILASLDPQHIASDDPQLEEAFRMAHTLKGGARVCDFRDLEALAHRMESLFAGVRENSVRFNVEVADTILRALDTIEDWMAAYTKGAVPPSSVESLKEIESCLHTAATQEAAKSCDAKRDTRAEPASRDSANPTTQSAGLQQLETLRVPTKQLDNVLRSVDALYALNDEHEYLATEFRSLSTEIHSLQHEAEAMRAAAGRVMRCLSATPEFAFIARQAESIAQRSRRISKNQRSVRGAHHRFSWALRTLSDDARRHVQRTRMVSADDVLQGLRPMVRNLARDEGKEIEFRTVGLDVRADRMVLQALKDPLIHVLRNAVVHGVESPDERASLGKDRNGQIQLALHTRGNRLQVLVEDNGRGIDPDRVAREAAQRGLLPDSSVQRGCDPGKLANFLFQPGFSTSSTVNELAGRGMGLSVVRDTVARLRGAVQIRPGSGAGTVLEISVPLFVTAERLLLVSSGEQVYAIPTDAINGLVRLRTADVQKLGGRTVAIVDDTPMPLVGLAQAVGGYASPSNGSRESLTVVVLGSTAQRVGIIVDELLAEREALIKELDAPAVRVKNFSGAIVLEDNGVALVVDPNSVAASSCAGVADSQKCEPVPANDTPTVLVVDDSFTTRTLEKSILETNGYDVHVAVDGVEALTVLRSERIDIVITDIEMPRMNGLTLLQEIRKDARFKALPVILVTSLDRLEDRQRGMDFGANAYIVKRRFDHQDLLDTIRRFM